MGRGRKIPTCAELNVLWEYNRIHGSEKESHDGGVPTGVRKPVAPWRSDGHGIHDHQLDEALRYPRGCEGVCREGLRPTDWKERRGRASTRLGARELTLRSHRGHGIRDVPCSPHDSSVEYDET